MQHIIQEYSSVNVQQILLATRERESAGTWRSDQHIMLATGRSTVHIDPRFSDWNTFVASHRFILILKVPGMQLFRGFTVQCCYENRILLMSQINVYLQAL